MAELSIPPVDLSDEGRLIALFARGDADAAGLLAYALHRRACLAFRADYAERTGQLPSAEAETAFLIAETTATRLAAYRQEAARLIAQESAAPPSAATPLPRGLRWSFGMPAMTAPGETVRVNWKGLFARLAVLMLAVIATALLLRVLFTRGA